MTGSDLDRSEQTSVDRGDEARDDAAARREGRRFDVLVGEVNQRVAELVADRREVAAEPDGASAAGGVVRRSDGGGHANALDPVVHPGAAFFFAERDFELFGFDYRPGTGGGFGLRSEGGAGLV